MGYRDRDPLRLHLNYELREDRPCREDRIYAAGLFDGEGSISIAPDKSKTGRPRYSLRIRVGMCDTEPIVWLHELWHGSVVFNRGETRAGWRSYHLWTAGGWDAAAFLTDIRPFLKLERVKKKTTLALAFQALKEAARRFDPAGPHYAQAVAHFSSYVACSSRLNKKGIAGETTATLNELFSECVERELTTAEGAV